MADRLTFKEILAEGLVKDSALDVNAAFRAHLDQILENKLNLIKEDVGGDCSLEIMSAARSFGGHDCDSDNGVIAVNFRTRAGVENFTDYLEKNDKIESYEIVASHASLDQDSQNDIGLDYEVDLEAVAENDTDYTFVVLAYLYPEHTTFDDDFDNDGDVDELDADMLSDDEFVESVQHEPGEPIEDVLQRIRLVNSLGEQNISSYSDDELISFMQTEEYDQLDEISKKTLVSYINKAGPSIHQHGFEQGMKKAAADEIDRFTNRHMPDQFANRDKLKGVLSATNKDQEASRHAAIKRSHGIKLAVARLTKECVDLNEEQIDEVMRKIRVSSRGLRSIKMACSKGFKWDPTIKACVKITGSELVVMRRASRRALITKRSLGSAFKVRVKRRVRKAFKFRQMMGLKV